ncbi:MAG: zinc ribbon domain-containing protein [Alphaproteobacteria bacterium]|nr:zinc ribbon domain-containing protein [Alphaproteobacteria bacterium]
MLITCPECGKKRSDEADFCPHCGCKRTESDGGGCFGLIALVVCIVLLAMCHTDTSKSTAQLFMTKNTVNYRDTPNGEILGQFPKGMKIACTPADGWCKMQQNGRDVYVAVKVLEKAELLADSGSGNGNGKEQLSSFHEKKGLIQAIEE